MVECWVRGVAGWVQNRNTSAALGGCLLCLSRRGKGKRGAGERCGVKLDQAMCLQLWCSGWLKRERSKKTGTGVVKAAQHGYPLELRGNLPPHWPRNAHTEIMLVMM